MIVLPEKPTVFCDVDETLVIWNESHVPKDQLEYFHLLKGEKFWIHMIHRKLLKEFKARGHNVVVWSAGGSDWAKLIVEKIHLTNVVDLVVSKPDWFIDDLSGKDILLNSQRIYFDMGHVPKKIKTNNKSPFGE
jgi:FMN phosphatase YigB (HAD superfamily)